jgi:Tol biopolymer transport system component
MRSGAGVALLTLILLTGAAPAGVYTPTPGDWSPAWSPDSTRIAFVTSRGGHALAVVGADGSGGRRLLERSFNSWAISPDWTRVATADTTLRISNLDGTGEHVITTPSLPVGMSWSPDSAHLAFAAGGAIYTVRADGSGLQRLVPGGAPAWAPGGSSIAFETGPVEDRDIHLISPDGSGERPLITEPGAQTGPAWSPGGTQIAFTILTSGANSIALGVARADGSALRTYPINFGGLAWAADGSSIFLSSSGIARISLPGGKTTQLNKIGFSPAPSPDGSRIAFSGGGECQDSGGIYVMNTYGTHQRRITNDCRIVGTAGGDVLHGTPLPDVLIGLGGNDRLFALDQAYTGDTLLGGTGDDVLSGGYRRNILSGGPGDDKLYGGPSGDRLVGGPGRDLIHGQGGQDFVYARDGRRDVIVCGTTTTDSNTPERDQVVADPIDRIAEDCEIVNGLKT